MSDELKHSGIGGMKWGIRRWRNPDGSLTAEGKERYNYYTPKAARAKEKIYYDQYDSSSGDSKFTKEVSGYARIPSAISKSLDDINFGVRTKSLSSKSDKELQEAIDRARLEADYAKYYPTTTKTSTRKKIDKFLAIAGTVGLVGIEAAKIYSGVVTAEKKVNDAYDKAVDSAASKAKIEGFLKAPSKVTIQDINSMTKEEFDTLTQVLKNYNTLNAIQKVAMP